MIERRLKVGDRIVDECGRIYVIEAVNKTTYRAKLVDGGRFPSIVPFNGIYREHSFAYEYFVFDDAQLKIIERLAKENKSLQRELAEQKGETRTLKANIEWLCRNKLSDLERCQDGKDVRIEGVMV